jgi:hypothetical protein
MYLINGKMKVFTKIKLNFTYIESVEYNSILSYNEGLYKITRPIANGKMQWKQKHLNGFANALLRSMTHGRENKERLRLKVHI